MRVNERQLSVLTQRHQGNAKYLIAVDLPVDLVRVQKMREEQSWHCTRKGAQALDERLPSNSDMSPMGSIYMGELPLLEPDFE